MTLARAPLALWGPYVVAALAPGVVYPLDGRDSRAEQYQQDVPEWTSGADASSGADFGNASRIVPRITWYDNQLLQKIDQCAMTIPDDFVPQDCYRLEYPDKNGFYEWVIPHIKHFGYTIAKWRTRPPPSCYLLPAREPAARIEEWYKANFGQLDMEHPILQDLGLL